MVEFRLTEEQLGELGRFARSLELNRGFVVHVMVGEDPALMGPALMHALGRSLEPDGQAVELRRFDHAHLDAVVPMLDAAVARADQERMLIIVDLSALARTDGARGCDLFTALNGRRDTLRTGLVGELVICIPAWLEASMLGAGPDLASAVRVWLLRREELDVGPLRRWRASCDARFEALLGSTAAAAQRYRHGTYTFSYCIEPGVVEAVPDLRERLAAVPGHTGWRPWWVPTSKYRPRMHDGALECWMFGGEQLFPDPAHSDYWRASGSGCLYLRRGYEEDSSETQQPGRLFSNSLAIWRVAEALLHVREFTRALGLAGHHRVAFEARWTGLEGRELSSWPERRARQLGESATGAESATTIRFSLEQLDAELEQLVEQVVGPLYEQFMARPTRAFIADQVEGLSAR